MINFQISLLLPTIIDNNTYFLQSIMTDYKDQINSYRDKFATSKAHHEYTYNEKIVEEENNQKTLTFSMDKTITSHNTIYTNPYINLLHAGSLVLLRDKYDKDKLFYVTKIDYSFQEFNIVYNVSCQDAFSYLVTKQRDGYSIQNDPTSSDFIGAENIDYWANKIAKECYVSYEYVALNEGIYENIYNDVFRYLPTDKLDEVKRIIKEPYSPQDDAELFETIPFATSGSAGSVLVSLGNEFGMHLKVVEKVSTPIINIADTNYEVLQDQNLQDLVINDIVSIKRYFWFEPAKNTKRLDLVYYRPQSSIQNFNMSNDTSSLTTILNVEGPTYNDEIVSLLPQVTPFFSSLFDSNYWDATLYYSGMFSQLCKGKAYFGIKQEGVQNSDILNSNFNYTIQQDRINKKIIVSIYWLASDFCPLSLYNIVGFGLTQPDGEKKESSIQLFDTSNTSILITPFTSRWTFKYTSAADKTVVLENGVEQNLLPSDKKWKAAEDGIVGYIEIDYAGDATYREASQSEIYLNFERKPSKEDLDFAYVADRCPWLENKLIDFKYFFENNIISKSDYTKIMNYFQNDLRIINGKLLYQAQQYYNNLHKQTKILADLNNSLDLLGATINYTFVTPYQKTLQSNNPEDFIKAYDAVFNKGIVVASAQKTRLLNFNDVKADYLNKFFNAQQRFFKNIKNFKDYFNSASDVDYPTEYTISFTSKDTSENVYSYQSQNDVLTKLPENRETFYNTDESSENYGKPYYTIYDEAGMALLIADKSMLNQLYQKDDAEATLVDWDEVYDSNAVYLDSLNGNQLSFNEIVKKYIEDKTYYYRKKQDREQIVLDNNINTLASTFFSYFNVYALYFIYPAQLISNEDNYEKYKVFDAFLPIKTYYDDQNYSYITATSDNEGDFYRRATPVLKGIYYGGNTAPYVFSYWKDLERAAKELRDNHRNLVKKGDSVYDLAFEKIQEYGQEQQGRQYSNYSDSLYEKWIDGDTPIYSKISSYNDEASVDTKTTNVAVTPQLAAKWELYYDKQTIIPIKADDDLRISSNYVFIPIRVGVNGVSTSILEGTHFLDDWKDENKRDQNIFSNILLYPLLAKSVQLAPELWNKQSTTTLNDIIVNSQGYLKKYNDDDYIFQVQRPGETGETFANLYIVGKICAYNLEEIAQDTDISNLIIVDGADQIVEFDKISGLTRDLYKKEKGYHQAQEFALAGQYYVYDVNTASYKPIPTMETSSDLYYKESASYKYYTYNDTDVNNFTFDIKIKNKATNKEFIKTVNVVFDENQTEVTQIIENDLVTFTKDKNSSEHTLSFIRTNGDFWYNYHNRDDQKILQEKAIMIEAQLNEYWMQAFTASKYCDYFIPEFWTNTVDGAENQYAQLIYQITTVDNGGLVDLLPTLLPDVHIYSLNNNTIFPKYVYSLREQETKAENIILPPVAEMFKVLDESVDNWYAIENGTTTYYYNNDSNTGYTWSNFLLHCFNVSYPEISGLYKMGFSLINKWFVDCPNTQYTQLKNQQQTFWRGLYNNYNFLLLENTYKNESATNSIDLLKLAQFAFKDYSKPEANYDISVIDVAALSNYDGSEIHIGDGIRIKADEYYNLYDNLYKDLSQFLFVTSISYELRKATDIKLGVNAIKYQDKLIQKLIKYLH